MLDDMDELTTPGPWDWTDGGETVEPGSGEIAELVGFGPWVPDAPPSEESSRAVFQILLLDPLGIIRPADARLVRASPLLLALVQGLVDSHDQECQNPDCGNMFIVAARSVLAKIRRPHA